jgi:hypothetical protein
MLVMLGEQPACYGQRSCIHDHGELAETTVGSLDTADGKTLFCYFWQYPGNAHISTINGSRGLVRRLFRWLPGSPWSGRGSVPGGRFHERSIPGREAELPNARTIANDAVRKPQLVRTITAMKTLSPGKHEKSCQFCQYARAAKALSIA